MRDYTRDVALAVRAMVRRPGYALPVIATLAVGIGANTAIFSIFNWILFRPVPGVERPEELVTVRYQRPQFTAYFWVSYRDYADIRDGASSLSGLAAAAPLKIDVSAGGDTTRRDAEVVTTNYFSLLGVRPTLGRDFAASEEQPGSAEPGAIIGGRLWRTAFNSDPAVLGKDVTLNGRRFVVVGVAPSGFQGRSLVTTTDVWIPIGAYPLLRAEESSDIFTNRHATLFSDSFGRLRRGATVAQAQAEAASAAANSPDFVNQSGRTGTRPRIGPVLTPGIGRDIHAEERLTTIFKLLMGAVGLLLLLACANAANLLLARGAGRRREIAVCQAIGASRLRIVRQLFIEGVVLSTAAGAAGLVLAIWLTSLFDGMRILTFLPAVKGVGIDWRVCAFAFGAALVTGVVFATAPAIVSSRVDLQPSLKDGITSSRHGRRLVRGSLLMMQVAVSVLLLVGASLFIRTLHNIRTLDLGLDVNGLISLGVEPGRYGYTTARSQAYVRDLIERLRSAPGIESAAFTQTTPYSAGRIEMTFLRPESPEEKVAAAATHVSVDFFKTMRIPIVAGRDFTATEVATFGDSRSKQGVVIVSTRLADQLFPNGGAVGSRVTLGYPKGKIVEIVGIAGDVRGRPLTNDPEPWSYAPTSGPTWGQIQVRSSLPTAEAIGTIRDVARALDPVVMPHDVESFGESIDRALSEQRLFARLSGVSAAVAGLLAGIGIYGMMAGAVMERRREFGIRIALGAKTAVVLRQVMRTAVWLAAAGVVCGVIAAAGLRRLIEARLYGVSGLDPATVAAAALAIVVLSVIASLVPAVRAARIDPAISLRAE